jgi:hypothetical protein
VTVACSTVVVLIVLSSHAAAQTTETRPGVPSAGPWTCPDDQPIKTNFTPASGERCIYHVPGGAFYEKAKPERCYAAEDDARKDGCRKARR